MAENPQQTQTITTADLPEPAPDATTGTPTAPTSTMTTATSAAGTGAMNGDVPPTGGGAGTDGENLQPAAPENGAVGADQQPVAGANLNEINGTWCDLSRLSKATLAAAIVAGNALAGAQRELGDGLDAFITTRTPWNLAEARALIAFAAQAGLQPEGLTPAVAVGLGRLLAATAVLGELYTAEVEQVNDITH